MALEEARVGTWKEFRTLMLPRIRAAGYDLEMSSTDDGWLRCGVCNEVVDPATAVVDRVPFGYR